MKYLVMEIHPGYAVVLDEKGRFLKCANMGYEVGQHLTAVELMHHKEKTPMKKWLYPLAAMAACLVLVFTAFFALTPQPYASVYLTINPEVRVDVDKNDIVVAIAGVNEDGTQLIKGYPYRGKHLDLVMDELVDRAIEMGYLHQGGQVTLTLDAQDQDWVLTHTDSLTAHLKEHMEHHQEHSFQVDIQISLHPKGEGGDHHPHAGHSDYSDTDYGQVTVPVTTPPTTATEPPTTAKPTEPPKPTQPKTDYEGKTDYDDRDDDDDDHHHSDYDKHSDYDDDDDDDD